MTSIILADDHEVVRRGLKGLLEAEEGFSVVGETGDGLEVAELVGQLRPEVLLLDLMMPGLNGLEVLNRVRKYSPATRVIIVSMHAIEAYVLEALKGGAVGYVLKDSDASDVVRAVHVAAEGGVYLSQSLTDRAIEAYVARAKEAPDMTGGSLTPREKEVLQLAAEGYNNTGIATRLGIRPRTAETHRSNLMRKLGVHSQVELMRLAIERGIVLAKPNIPA